MTPASVNGAKLSSNNSNSVDDQTSETLLSFYYNGDTQHFSPPNIEMENNPTPLLSSPSKNLSNINIKKKRKEKITIKRKTTTKKQSPPKQQKRLSTDQNYYCQLSEAGDDDCPPLPAPVISPRANESSATKPFRVYSHNVNGLRDETKLEFIPRTMEKNDIDAYLIQETHLAGDFEKYLINGYYIIHHGPETQPINGAKGGVAIILSPQMTYHWKISNRAKKKFTGGISVGNTTRLLSISMRFEQQDASKVKKYQNLCLTSNYFPYSGYKEAELVTFNDQVTSFLSEILSLKNTTHIIGADTNASIGPRASLESENLKKNRKPPRLRPCKRPPRPEW